MCPAGVCWHLSFFFPHGVESVVIPYPALLTILTSWIQMWYALSLAHFPIGVLVLFLQSCVHSSWVPRWYVCGPASYSDISEHYIFSFPNVMVLSWCILLVPRFQFAISCGFVSGASCMRLLSRVCTSAEYKWVELGLHHSTLHSILPWLHHLISFPDYSLSERVACYMCQCFSSLAFPQSGTTLPEPLFDLPVHTTVGMNHLVAMLVAAYQNPSA